MSEPRHDAAEDEHQEARGDDRLTPQAVRSDAKGHLEQRLGEADTHGCRIRQAPGIDLEHRIDHEEAE